ncbi:MAG TPA: RNA-binding transcriptional accessory protein [Lachnospiraceae bacterium]|nr:RNA-binding transcriptional accessory protein [Lachnospiraceae bacterium]
MNIEKKIAEELGIKTWQVEAVVSLIDEGNTIPFIARYRKEKHGSLDDEKLRELDERLRYLRSLEERKETILASIEEQGKLTDELKEKINAAETMVLLEDLYRPYKQKRRTRATIAKEKGLEPLADAIFEDLSCDPETLAAEYIDEEKEVSDVVQALAGAMDILAERFSDEADFRTHIRRMTWEDGVISVTKKGGKDDETADDAAGEDIQASKTTAKASETTNKKLAERKSVYETYYEFTSPLKKLQGYQTLAINRGEREKFLTVRIEAPTDDILSYLAAKLITDFTPQIAAASQGKQLSELTHDARGLIFITIEDAYKRLIAPAIERELRTELTEGAEDGAIHVFGKNLTQLLMQPPIKDQVVLGWDPAFRTGCKLAVVDATGKVLHTVVVYPTAPQNKIEETKKTVKALIDKYDITLISVGNGTASRESELVIADMLKEINKPVHYVIVNEAGASVYSASKRATEEFPEFDVGQRSAVSIARRIQDPLAELVKIEPKSIGVGQYQHDMNQKKLDEALGAVVEDCVNHVGVDLNTASASLLEYVSGVSKPIAKNIVAYREANGKFHSRKELLKVAKLGPKAYEQCAGFLRITDGTEPLDGTAVHPESYEPAKELLKDLGYDGDDVRDGLTGLTLMVKDRTKLAAKLGIGEETLNDIISELEKPGRDPRDEMPKPILRGDVLEMTDLSEGMVLKGTVRNVIDFGAFVDIGVHQDGLVHISQLTDKKFVKHPLDVVSVGDVVDVKVLSVDVKKKRISLSMII